MEKNRSTVSIHILRDNVQRSNAKHLHSMTIQKGKLEAFVKVIERLAVENGSVPEGIYVCNTGDIERV